MIDVVDVTQHYGVRPVLRNVSLRIESGELVCLMGPSSLLKVVAGLLWPIKGHTEINGLRRRATPEDELAIRRQVVYLPDHPWLPSNMTGREFLVAVGNLYEIDVDRLMEHADRLLKLFDLTEQGNAPIRTYSNGQQKKIAICSVLVTEAPVMVLDEPFTGGLDPSGILALRRVLRQLADRSDVTVLMATQIPEIAEALAHRIAVISQGELMAYASPEDLQTSTQCKGSLQEALGRLMHSDTLDNIEQYFQGVRK